jgi:foldase protein PrsA
MRHLPTRRLAPLAVLLTVALGLSACGSVGQSPAATVNEHDISADSIRSELRIIRDNGAYRDALERSYQMTLAGQSKGTFDSSFTAQMLSLRIYYELVEQSFEKLGIKVTKSDETRAKQTIKQQVDTLGKNVWKSLPKDYRDQLGHQEALIEVASNEAGDGKIGRDYFNAHKSDFAKICVSHILVSSADHSDADAKRIANEIKAELDGGADFATVAKEKSEDPGSKDSGGDLDCDAPGRFVEAFDKATQTLPVGKVSDPVKTQFGYHLILVRSRTAGVFSDVSASLGQKAFEDYLLTLVCGKKSDVHVNPRYGTWDRKPCKGGAGLAQVAPPAKPKSSGSTTTTTTTVAGP